MNNLKSVFLALWLVMGVTVNAVAQSAADLYKRANQQYVLLKVNGIRVRMSMGCMII